MRSLRLRLARVKLSWTGRKTAQKWLSTHKADIALALAWGLITWSAFLWKPRAWAASVGLYLLVEALSPVIAEWFAAKRDAQRGLKDR